MAATADLGQTADGRGDGEAAPKVAEVKAARTTTMGAGEEASAKPSSGGTGDADNRGATTKGKRKKSTGDRVRGKGNSTSGNVLQFDADFESGNMGPVRRLNEIEYEIVVRPDTCNSKHALWFYFRVRGAAKGQQAVLTLTHFSKTRSLFLEGMTPVMRSTSRPMWQRILAQNTFYYRSKRHGNTYALSIVCEFDRGNDEEYFFAYNFPYTYTDVQSYLFALENRALAFLSRDLVCRTAQGRRIDVLTIDESPYPTQRLGKSGTGMKSARSPARSSDGSGSPSSTRSSPRRPLPPTGDRKRASPMRARGTVTSGGGMGGGRSPHTKGGSPPPRGVPYASSISSSLHSSPASSGGSPGGTMSPFGGGVRVPRAGGLGGGSASSRPLIVITARVHPGESPAQFMCQGVLDFLCSQNPCARALRRAVRFKVVPILNPDGVFLGNYRCSSLGYDLNRTWTEPSPALQPETYGVKNWLLRLAARERLKLVVDLHSHSTSKNVFMLCNQFGSGGVASNSQRNGGAPAVAIPTTTTGIAARGGDDVGVEEATETTADKPVHAAASPLAEPRPLSASNVAVEEQAVPQTPNDDDKEVGAATDSAAQQSSAGNNSSATDGRSPVGSSPACSPSPPTSISSSETPPLSPSQSSTDSKSIPSMRGGQARAIGLLSQVRDGGDDALYDDDESEFDLGSEASVGSRDVAPPMSRAGRGGSRQPSPGDGVPHRVDVLEMTAADLVLSGRVDLPSAGGGAVEVPPTRRPPSMHRGFSTGALASLGASPTTASAALVKSVAAVTSGVGSALVSQPLVDRHPSSARLQRGATDSLSGFGVVGHTYSWTGSQRAHSATNLHELAISGHGPRSGQDWPTDATGVQEVDEQKQQLQQQQQPHWVMDPLSARTPRDLALTIASPPSSPSSPSVGQFASAAGTTTTTTTPTPVISTSTSMAATAVLGAGAGLPPVTMPASGQTPPTSSLSSARAPLPVAAASSPLSPSSPTPPMTTVAVVNASPSPQQSALARATQEARAESHLPRVLDAEMPDFSFVQTTFDSDSSKAGTSRRVLGEAFRGKCRVYTLEASFFGREERPAGHDKTVLTPYTAEDYIDIGRQFGRALAVYCEVET